MNKLGNPFFVTKAAWNPSRSHNFLVCCSDGNYRKAHSEFMEKFLMRPDKIAWPGGAGAFSNAASWCETLIKPAQLLSAEHGIIRVVGLVHEDCAHYLHLMEGKSPQEILDQQRLDAIEFKRIMNSICPEAVIGTYFERPWKGKVAYFEI